jgi:hypothetical protein
MVCGRMKENRQYKADKAIDAERIDREGSVEG